MCNRSIFAWSFAAVLTAFGCRPAEQVETYRVPRESVAAVAPAATTDATDRMLAAVLPESDRAWFFKITGPRDAIDAQAESILAFFASVRPAPTKPHPDWELPANWQEQPGSGMRAATLLVPGAGQPLELSVTALPWSGREGELLSNVNRWRGQMQLAPTDDAGLTQLTRELKVGDATMTIVDLTGRSTGGMMPPFAGGAAPLKPTAPADSALPPGHPPVAAAPNSALPAPFSYDVPEGWQDRPASGMRKAELHVGTGEKSAVVTAIDFPADSPPMMSDPVANVRRWRGEVGLAPLADEELKATLQPFDVDGSQGVYVEVVPDASQTNESQANRATLAVMFTRGDRIWFVKLSGERDTVAAQRDKFSSFLKSVRFAESGAGDGNQ